VRRQIRLLGAGWCWLASTHPPTRAVTATVSIVNAQVPLGTVTPVDVSVFDSQGHVFPASQYPFMNLTFVEMARPLLAIDPSNFSAIVATGQAVGTTSLRASVQNCVRSGDGAVEPGSWVVGDMRCWSVVSAWVEVVVFPPMVLLPGRVSLLPDARCVHVCVCAPVQMFGVDGGMSLRRCCACVSVCGRLLLVRKDGPRSAGYRFRVSNDSVVGVDHSGMVLGVGIGVSIVTVEAFGTDPATGRQVTLDSASCVVLVDIPKAIVIAAPNAYAS
jgi:hypothetical protein